MRFKIGDIVTFIGSKNSKNQAWRDFVGTHGMVRDSDSTHSVVMFEQETPNGGYRATITNVALRLKKKYASHPYTTIFKQDERKL